MGWWMCNERGGIDFKSKIRNGFVNALPECDSDKDFYNGDGPADFMGGPSELMKDWFKGRPKKPTTQNLIDLFVNNKVDKIFNFIDPKKIKNLVANTWREIDRMYQDDWGRPTYKQEKFYVCNFVFSCMDWEDF